MNSADSYEKNAQRFLQGRDKSSIGARVVTRWARSLKTHADVLEIACGGGIPVTRSLIRSGLKVRAIDSSPTLLATFKDRFPEIETQCANIQESNFFDMQFDAAIAVGLIFLLPSSDQITALSRVAEALRPGASFLFSAPVETGHWTDSITGHICKSPGREVYEQALVSSGFRVVGLHLDSGGNNYFEAEKSG